MLNWPKIGFIILTNLESVEKGKFSAEFGVESPNQNAPSVAWVP